MLEGSASGESDEKERNGDLLIHDKNGDVINRY